MRVLVASDSFSGTLTANQACAAIAEGWARTAPGDQVVVAPMADGGAGFVDVLHTALAGTLTAAAAQGPLGEPVPVTLLRVGDVTYVESAQACGLHLMDPDDLDPWRASSYGVGEAIAAAVETGARTVVVGLGGSAANDAGVGMLAALGAESDVPLSSGPSELEGIGRLDLDPVRERLAGVELVIAADVDTPLLGMFGTTKVFGPGRGLATDDDMLRLDRLLDDVVEATCGSTPAERRIADQPGAGAAGGVGFALLALDATMTSGIGLVAEASGLEQLARGVDLVITGEGAFDYASRTGTVVNGVADVAQRTARPCIVLAGRVDVGAREMRALGVESAYGITDRVDEQTALAAPAEQLAALAARVARSWSIPTGDGH